MHKHKDTLTPARLHEVLDYDADTGVFTWAKSRVGARKGDIAGNVNRYGYRRITIDYVSYLEHRLAWFYVWGVWPSEQIDHKEGVRSHNALNGLREATNAENSQNTAREVSPVSKMLGVYFNKDKNLWQAQIRIKGRKTNLGRFSTAEEAHQAYLSAKAEHHTFNPNPRRAKAG